MTQNNFFSSTKISSIASILASILYTSVFLYLATKFDYPKILDVEASKALPNLISMGTEGRSIWTIYALIPLLWIPIGVGIYNLLKKYNPGGMLIALIFAIIGGFTGFLGLARWSTIQWQLGEAFINSNPEQKEIISSIFRGLNLYLGQFIGEFVSEFSWSLFFVITGFTLLKTASGKWFSYLTIFTGFIHLIAMFRNVWAPANEVQNIINLVLFLPIYLIIFGVVFWRLSNKIELKN